MKVLDRLFKLEEINGGERCPTYLYRWTLLRLGSWLAVYLHKFVGEDWSLDLHDHPKRFVSIGLRGWYRETKACDVGPSCFWRGDDGACPGHVIWWKAPWFRTFPATHVHRIDGPTHERPCWTLVIVGRAVRPWGFWHAGTWIPWRKYVNSTTADERKACP